MEKEHTFLLRVLEYI